MEEGEPGVRRPVHECVLEFLIGFVVRSTLTCLFRFPGFTHNDITMSFRACKK